VEVITESVDTYKIHRSNLYKYFGGEISDIVYALRAGISNYNSWIKSLFPKLQKGDITNYKAFNFLDENDLVSPNNDHKIEVKEAPFKIVPRIVDIPAENKEKEVAKLKKPIEFHSKPAKGNFKLNAGQINEIDGEDLKSASVFATPRIVPCNRLKGMSQTQLIALAKLKNEANERSLKTSTAISEENVNGFNKKTISDFTHKLQNLEKNEFVMNKLKKEAFTE